MPFHSLVEFFIPLSHSFLKRLHAVRADQLAIDPVVQQLVAMQVHQTRILLQEAVDPDVYKRQALN